MIKQAKQSKRRQTQRNRFLLLSAFLGLVLLASIYAGTKSLTEAAEPSQASLVNAPSEQEAVPAAVNQTNFALYFDGIDDLARAVDIGNFDFDTSFTIETWVKPDLVISPTGSMGLVSGRDVNAPNGTGGYVMFRPSADASTWGMSVCTPICEASTAPSGSLVPGEWHHLAAVYNGTSIKIYHNGLLTGTVAHSGDVSDVSFLFLGAWTSSFSGVMDEVRIWNIARPVNELLMTMFAPLQGNESGLVAYWPMNEGTGQFTEDASGNGQSLQRGASDGVDDLDPTWVPSDSPIVGPLFQLKPLVAGLGTDIGASSVVVPGFNCGWIAGETVEIWWDDPEVKLATFTVEPNGCFEGLFNLDDTELLAGSVPGAHVVTAIGSASGNFELPFEQSVSQLHLDRTRGPSDFDVAFDGCGWDGASIVTILWQADFSDLAVAAVDGGTGCIEDNLRIPLAEDGFYELLAFSDFGHVSAAVYWVKSPTIFLTPDEGPPGARIPMASCGWLPQEQVDFAFTSNYQTFDSWGTSLGGCITTGGPLDPWLSIPVTATLGAKTVQATGQDSGFVVDVLFTVVTRTLVLDPDTGQRGDPVAASGCGWVENSLVSVEWGYPDNNNQPILWQTSVDSDSGCFGQGGSFTFTVPANTIGGTLVQTASGDVVGTATDTFTVTHGGWIEFSDPDGYAGYTMTVNIHDASVGESITFRWDVGHAFDGVGAATPNFSYDITLPKYASVGQHTVTADGTHGFDDQAMVNILDNSEIAVLTGGDILPGQAIRVEGTDWSAGELVRFKLLDGTNTWPIAGSITVGADEIDFDDFITLPADVPPGAYTLLAEGNKGRVAETSLNISAPPPVAFSLTADYAEPPPDLDGLLRRGEWDYGSRFDFGRGFISARSDDSRLYLLLDLLEDDGQDSPGLDNFWLSFDVWGNGQIDSDFDLNFRLDSSGELIWEEYTGPNSFDPRNSSLLRSAYSAGFGCFVGDGSLSVYFIGFISQISCSQHRLWEIGIDLASIGAEPGDTVRLGVKAVSQSPAFDDEIPSGFPSDFSELGAITLASSKLESNPPDGTVLGFGSDGFEMEVTQAIQDADNSMPLVADKDTVVRVYPDVEAEALVRVFLFGRRSGMDLPGSPLVTLVAVPEVIDREEIRDTANFLLPDSWIEEGNTQFTTIIENLNGQNSNARVESVNFFRRDIPVIWVFPFNEGTRASPLLPTQADMVEQEVVMEGLLPVPDVVFVHKQWTEIGTTGVISFTTMKKELMDYWRTTAAAAASSSNLSSLPDMLYGFKVGRDPKAVGTSDPIYSGGSGLVVVGQADGRDFNSTTMIHEVNHNLDRSRQGTWGRHVANPENVDSKAWGCGADGPDSAWPYDGTDNVQEVGFDPTLPWTDGSGQHLTVVPDTRDDFMSYCWKKGTPIQWISPYRWQNMFGRFFPSRAQDNLRATESITNVYYLSGQVNQDGTGSLSPLLTLPGVVATPIVTGAYSIEIEDISQQLLFSTTFTAIFTDAEGVAIDSVDFSFQLPVQPNAAKFVLKQNGLVLYSLEASPNPPTVTVTAPTGGDVWSGEETISWTANDLDGDSLQFTILYSPDEGANWFPVAYNLTGTEYVVDEGRLPGGSGGKVQVIASDGFHTVQAQSNGVFTVPHPAPIVSIISPVEDGAYYPSRWITLQGLASDALASPAEAFTYTWTLDDELFDVGSETSLLLDEGEYTITLRVFDALGNFGESSVTIKVTSKHDHVFVPFTVK